MVYVVEQVIQIIVAYVMMIAQMTVYKIALVHGVAMLQKIVAEHVIVMEQITVY